MDLTRGNQRVNRAFSFQTRVEMPAKGHGVLTQRMWPGACYRCTGA